MKRKPPEIAPPEVRLAKDPDYETQERKYKLITPLYGGGEEPNRPDSVTVVRPSEIRGHLRFWWRATRGGEFDGSIDIMRRREEYIWGSTTGEDEKGNIKAGPSKVVIQIREWSKNREETNNKQVRTRQGFRIVHISDPKWQWSYFTWPLRETERGVWENVVFTLAITYPKELSKEIEAALWAWETFGGIGARTRRGFGALDCLSSTGAPAGNKHTVHQIESALDERLTNYVVKGKWPKGVPHLIPGLVYRLIIETDPMKAWEALIRALREFRQEKARAKLDENGQIRNDKFGVSQWPEANEIRRLLGGKPRLLDGGVEPTTRKFPRAVFGLPLPFNMYHDSGLKDKHISLEGKGDIDRLASPLILRPLTCSNGAVGLAAILEWTPWDKQDGAFSPPGGLELKSFKGDFQVESKLTNEEAKQIPSLGKEKDVLQAFLDFVESNHKEE